MKKKRHIQDNQELTILWLTQTIERELARGEEADEQCILECTAYLQELSPETAVPAKTTEKYLLAELKNTKKATPIHAATRKSHRRILKATLRLASVIAALACFCIAIPAVAAYVFNENEVVSPAGDFLKPVMEILTQTAEPKSIDYPNADAYRKKSGYHATYSTVQTMLAKEHPADVLCLNDLPASLGEYNIQVVHYDGRTTSERWKIRWVAKDNRWGYLIAYYDTPHILVKLNRPDYEGAYERYHVNGRTYFYRVQADGSYWATCIQGRIQYSVLAPDYQTMTFLIDHAVAASDIIPAATSKMTLPAPAQCSPLERYSDAAPSPFSNNDYLAYYETTDDFLKSEGVDILTVNDRVSERLDCFIRVEERAAPITTAKWRITWHDEKDQWMFIASAQSDKNTYTDIKAYEQLSQYYEKYTVGERTFYIKEISPSPKEIVFDDYTLIATCLEDNVWYYINAVDRETLEYVISNLCKASELTAP